MELITKVYSRSQTYQKRKKGLKKKALEFSTLCGVDTCMILYGPNHKGQTRKAEVWPDSPSEVFRIIGKYKAKAFDSHAVRSFDLFDFFSRRNKKIQDDILKLRKTNITAKFPTWNNSLNNLSLDQIKALLIKFDAVLEVVKMKVMMIKEDKRLIDESSIIPCINPINNFRKDSSLQKEMKPEAVSTYLKPYGAMQIMPQFSPADQTTLYNQIAVQQVDHHVNSLDHYNQMIMMMMVMNEFDIKIRDKQGAKDFFADHLSRLEQTKAKENKVDINESFPDEQLFTMMVAQAL
ncbi:agamous-like MADS-box protein AGL82 [Carica papaya]|uniref:agamous-like MADS-box protein AGL82 n=1 Tax=Carica papaya TaxID=3649 RepID=UPI000B8C7808|nr:agamous-like MADS-box protein AGL82 [Carica papaya]